MAEDANNPNFISKIRHLELANAVHPNSDDIAFKQGSSKSNFLLSDDKSKLWLTLQLAFQIKKYLQSHLLVECIFCTKMD